MSKRHQSSRRKSYGRRQHELRERHDRVHHSTGAAFELDDWTAAPSADPFAFMDPRTPRLRLVLGD